jgi:hypothetical protein
MNRPLAIVDAVCDDGWIDVPYVRGAPRGTRHDLDGDDPDFPLARVVVRSSGSGCYSFTVICLAFVASDDVFTLRR